MNNLSDSKTRFWGGVAVVVGFDVELLTKLAD